MGIFKEWLNEGLFGFGKKPKYAMDPVWKDLWLKVLDYYGRDVLKAEAAIDKAIAEHGGLAPTVIEKQITHRPQDDWEGRTNWSGGYQGGGKF